MAADGLLVDNFVALAEAEGMYFSGPDQRYGTNTNGITGKAPMKSWPPTTRPSVRHQPPPSGRMPTTQP